mmetsp:Transcript_24672/g.58726  ORF Transcript_24672/g.58726 Transcript_24672/m.58726 type:complete len:258 (-) Transcript_24672:187-960(-)
MGERGFDPSAWLFHRHVSLQHCFNRIQPRCLMRFQPPGGFDPKKWNPPLRIGDPAPCGSSFWGSSADGGRDSALGPFPCSGQDGLELEGLRDGVEPNPHGVALPLELVEGLEKAIKGEQLHRDSPLVLFVLPRLLGGIHLTEDSFDTLICQPWAEVLLATSEKHFASVPSFLLQLTQGCGLNRLPWINQPGTEFDSVSVQGRPKLLHDNNAAGLARLPHNRKNGDGVNVTICRTRTPFAILPSFLLTIADVFDVNQL